MKKLFTTALFLLSLTTLSYAQALNTNKSIDMVVATVNDQAITLQELKNRITLTKMLISRKLSANEFEMLKQQAMEQLINEELKRQYAKDKKIVVSPKELSSAIKLIEQQRGLSTGQLITQLPSRLRQTALNQIKDSIIQQKIIRKVIAKKVFIPDYQVDTLLDNVINQAQSKEYKIAQIRLNATNNRQHDIQKINKLHKQLINGDKFEDLVAAFSQDENKLNGGVLGWFSLKELDQKLQLAVEKLAKGEFSKPVKINNSWIIVKVVDEKITKNIDTTEHVQYKFVLFDSPVLKNYEIKEVKQKLKSVNGYSDFESLKAELQNSYKFVVNENINWINLDDIPQQHKNKVLNTLASNFSEVVENNNKVRFIYLLDVRTKQSDQVEQIRERIKRNLQNAQAERKFKQFAKKLRSEAFIEIR